MSTHTDKIREALELEYQHLLGAWQMASGPLTRADVDMRINKNRDALAALAELEKERPAQGAEEAVAPLFWYRDNMEKSAHDYANNLREPFKSDPVIFGIAEQAFIAGRANPAIELANWQASRSGPEPMTEDQIRLLQDDYEALLEANTSHDVTMRLNMVAAFGAALRQHGCWLSPSAPVEELVKAGEAVIARWDSPLWEWATHGPTSNLISDLRNAISALTSGRNEQG